MISNDCPRSLAAQHMKENACVKVKLEQECIPVGCVPPAHWPYLHIASYPMHAPQSNHTHPPEQPCMPPRATTHAPLEQPHMPPGATTHTPLPWSNHACPPHPQSNHTSPPLGATMHAPLPPRATTHPPATTHALPWEQPCTPPRRQTDTCKNITFANFVCGR